MKVTSEVIVLGAGMAGLGAGHFLSSQGISAAIYDRNPYYGGHAASSNINGFVFDEGPHISFTANKKLQKLFSESVNTRFEILQARVNNYWQGYWFKHPAQCNLYGLPHELVVEIIDDFIKAQNSKSSEIKNYKEWLYANFGKAFAENFPMKYGLKYHTTSAENMSIDWIGPRLYRPDVKEVLRGALTRYTPEVHYVDNFRYPTSGGFVSFLKIFTGEGNFQGDHELINLDPHTKIIEFANGKQIPYDKIISSIPLPELVRRITGVPPHVIKASEDLACTSCIVVTIGINRQDISEAHWSYFYDDDFCFSRLSFPHMQSPNNVPSGTGSIQAEIYFSKKYKPVDRSADDCIEPVLRDLKRCGLVKESDKIVFTHAKIIQYANIIFDLDRTTALEVVHDYLDEIGVSYCGRYGEWGYHWTDQSFVSGEKAAQKIVEQF
ncbi:MAG: NAD(P)-binding protein [Desulforhopalus sp.]